MRTYLSLSTLFITLLFLSSCGNETAELYDGPPPVKLYGVENAAITYEYSGAGKGSKTHVLANYGMFQKLEDNMTYTFTEPEDGLSYTAYVEIVYNGNTYRFEEDLPVVTDSHAKRVLDALEAVIEGRASKSQLRQKVGGVEVEHMSLSELVKFCGIFRAKVRKEDVLAGTATPNRTIKTRFV